MGVLPPSHRVPQGLKTRIKTRDKKKKNNKKVAKDKNSVYYECVFIFNLGNGHKASIKSRTPLL